MAADFDTVELDSKSDSEPAGPAGMPAKVDNPSKATPGSDKNLRSLRVVRILAIISIILLFIQFLLGMWANLFASFPIPVPSVNPIDQIFTDGPTLLAIHVVVGILLGILSIAGLALAVHTKDRRLILLEVSALASILLAGESGIEFVLSGYQDDILSYTMAVGFILVFLVYSATELARGRNDGRRDR